MLYFLIAFEWIGNASMKQPFGKLESGDEQQDGFNPSDLPQLPPDYLKLVRYVMRYHPISYAALRSAMQALPAQDAVPVDDIQGMLDVLVREGHIQMETEGDAVTYRAQIRRHPGRSATMQSIWNVLDAQETGELSPETAINPELRRTRSALADSMLAYLSKLPVATPIPKPTSDTQGTAKSLMADLMATGRSSMAKRAGIVSASEPQENQSANTDQEAQISPDNQKKDPSDATDKLRDLFSKRKSS
jgi:hypothetical protein